MGIIATCLRLCRNYTMNMYHGVESHDMNNECYTHMWETTLATLEVAIPKSSFGSIKTQGYVQLRNV